MNSILSLVFGIAVFAFVVDVADLWDYVFALGLGLAIVGTLKVLCERLAKF